jgi:hypothetical protein
VVKPCFEAAVMVVRFYHEASFRFSSKKKNKKKIAFPHLSTFYMFPRFDETLFGYKVANLTLF